MVYIFAALTFFPALALGPIAEHLSIWLPFKEDYGFPMSKEKHRTKFVTKDIFKCSGIRAFTKLNPKYMMQNPVMFVVEIGFVIALLLSPSSPRSSGPPTASTMPPSYNIFVCVILFVTVLCQLRRGRG